MRRRKLKDFPVRPARRRWCDACGASSAFGTSVGLAGVKPSIYPFRFEYAVAPTDLTTARREDTALLVTLIVVLRDRSGHS
jgi:hypothetical protein